MNDSEMVEMVAREVLNLAMVKRTHDPEVSYIVERIKLVIMATKYMVLPRPELRHLIMERYFLLSKAIPNNQPQTDIGLIKQGKGEGDGAAV